MTIGLYLLTVAFLRNQAQNVTRYKESLDFKMSSFNLPEPQLLKVLLEPLLEDFQYWFSRSRSFLEAEKVSCLSPQEQADLLGRVVQSQQEVTAAQSLFKVTNGQVGVEPRILMSWHQLVTECWQVKIRFRLGTA